MSIILNKRDTRTIPPGAVYVGRPSKWGNPFSIDDVRGFGTKAERHQAVVDRYRDWIHTKPHLMAALGELRGKDLVCWCAPLPCHADVLLEFANVSGVKR